MTKTSGSLKLDLANPVWRGWGKAGEARKQQNKINDILNEHIKKNQSKIP